MDIDAVELKKRGAKGLADHLNDDEEVIIRVRGIRRFVVVSLERYNTLRECEISHAAQAAREDLQKGAVISQDLAEKGLEDE